MLRVLSTWNFQQKRTPSQVMWEIMLEIFFNGVHNCRIRQDKKGILPRCTKGAHQDMRQVNHPKAVAGMVVIR